MDAWIIAQFFVFLAASTGLTLFQLVGQPRLRRRGLSLRRVLLFKAG